MRLEERERSAGDIQTSIVRDAASLRQKDAVLDSVLADFGGDKNVSRYRRDLP